MRVTTNLPERRAEGVSDTSMMMTLDPSQGHYAADCNLPGHYRSGMYQDFWVVPPAV